MTWRSSAGRTPAGTIDPMDMLTVFVINGLVVALAVVIH
jgi:hypothetical protein